MKKAVVDIGTNTIKLKVFLNNVLLESKTFPVQIGNGLKKKVITEEKIGEIKSCFQEIKKIVEENDCKITDVIGTSALRDAKNDHEIQKIVQTFCKVDLQIIDGVKEAEYIYKGVRKGIESTENYLICDIGGGSVELIYGNNKEVIALKSFELGVIKLKKIRTNSNPLSQEDIQFYFELLEVTLSEFLTSCKTTHLVGAAGSFETMFALIHGRKFSGEFETIDIFEMNKVLKDILKSTQIQRDANLLIPVERKIVLPFGAIVVLYLLIKLEIDKFTLSPNSLIEGFI